MLSFFVWKAQNFTVAFFTYSRSFCTVNVQPYYLQNSKS